LFTSVCILIAAGTTVCDTDIATHISVLKGVECSKEGSSTSAAVVQRSGEIRWWRRGGTSSIHNWLKFRLPDRPTTPPNGHIKATTFIYYMMHDGRIRDLMVQMHPRITLLFLGSCLADCRLSSPVGGFEIDGTSLLEESYRWFQAYTY